MRKNIPDGGKNLTDEQIIRLRDDMETFANIAFQMWMDEKNEKKLASIAGASSTDGTTKPPDTPYTTSSKSEI